MTHYVLEMGSDPILSTKNSLDLLRWAQLAKLLSTSGQLMPPANIFIALTTAICRGFRTTICLLPIYPVVKTSIQCQFRQHLLS